MTDTPPTNVQDLYAALSALIHLPKNAQRITITMEIGKPPTVQCEFPARLAGKLPGCTRIYTLREIETPDA